jgi:hypothetical protein
VFEVVFSGGKACCPSWKMGNRLRDVLQLVLTEIEQRKAL